MAEEKKNGVSVKKAHSEGNQKAKFVSRLETKYQEEIVPELMKEFGYSSIMECPKLVKIILNMRLGEAGSNSKSVEEAVNEMAIISGQHPIVTKANGDISSRTALSKIRLQNSHSVVHGIISLALPIRLRSLNLTPSVSIQAFRCSIIGRANS